MLQLRISAPADRSQAVEEVLRSEPTVGDLAIVRGALIDPAGDLYFADVPRENANTVIDRLRETGVQREGSIQIESVPTWISRRGFEAERQAPGTSPDAVVWSEVVQRAYDDSQLTWTYVSFMLLATLIAGIAIILDSQILVIGAMVLGPEFGPIAALGLALVRKRHMLGRIALRTLLIGFLVAILTTTLVTLGGRWFGWVTVMDVVGPRPGTQFIYTPDRWTIVVAVIAGAAGVLALTSARSGGLVGVFISVTTIPAAGNIAVALAFGVWAEVWGSLLQLVVNITGMALAGWLTLLLQERVWQRVLGRRRRRAALASGSSRPGP